MTLKTVAVLLSVAGLVGIALGYYLRLIISLGKKGSMELEIKEMLLTAKEEAKKNHCRSRYKSKENPRISTTGNKRKGRQDNTDGNPPH